jgi:nucleoside-diphosphate-sugar epimerase
MVAGRKILVTGATGTIARPVAEDLARHNEVWVPARFSDPASREQLEALGVHTCAWDMAGDNSGLPDDFDHVLHSAFYFGPSLEDHDRAIALNAEAPALLMQHCRKARSFVHVSTFCCYRRQEPGHFYSETDPLGTSVSFSASYPMSKIAGEGAVRAAARMLGLPTTIARMNIGHSHVGGTGGLPISFYEAMAAGQPIPLPAGPDELCSPIGAHDMARLAHGLFEIASVPATVVNWAGDEAVTTRELCEFIAELAGVTATFVESPVWYDFYPSDNAKRQRLIGKCETGWKDGIRDLFARRLGIGA